MLRTSVVWSEMLLINWWHVRSVRAHFLLQKTNVPLINRPFLTASETLSSLFSFEIGPKNSYPLYQSIIPLAQSVTGSNECLRLTSGHEGLPNFKVAGGCATCLCSLFRASFRAWTVDMMLFLLVIPWWIGSFATLVFVNIDLSLIRLTLILFQHRVNGRSFPLVYSPEFLSRISPPNFMFYDPLKMGMAIKTLFKPTHSQGHS